MTDLTYRQAAKELDITISSIVVYVSKKMLAKGKKRATVTNESVQRYKNKRNPDRVRAAMIANGTLRYKTQGKKRKLIYLTLIKFFADHGRIPTYDELSPLVHLAKSGIGRHIRELADLGLIENLSPSQYYPTGLAEKIKEIVKRDYANELKKLAELTET